MKNYRSKPKLTLLLYYFSLLLVLALFDDLQLSQIKILGINYINNLFFQKNLPGIIVLL